MVSGECDVLLGSLVVAGLVGLILRAAWELGYAAGRAAHREEP